MRKIATHRVYDAESGKISSQQVVELDEQGYVLKMYSFSEEIRYTEWLGDLIILSPLELPKILPDESFSHFKERIASLVQSEGKESPKKAYWMTPFNVSEMEFTSDTHVIVFKSI